MAITRPRTLICRTCGAAFETRGSRTLPFCPAHRPRPASDRSERTHRQHEIQAALAEAHPESLLAVLARGGEDEYFDPTNMPEPTGSEPGSSERVEIYAARYLAGLALWEKSDFRRDTMTVQEIEKLPET